MRGGTHGNQKFPSCMSGCPSWNGDGIILLLRTSAFLPLDEDGRPPFPEKSKTPGKIASRVHLCGNLLRGSLYAIHRLLLSFSRLTGVPSRALLSVQVRD